MSDSTGAVTADAGEQSTGQAVSDSTFEPITSQEGLDKIVQARLARERSKFSDYEELKAKAAKLDEAEESSKSEIQKAIERAEKAERELQSQSVESERLRVIAKHAIPADYQDLITAGDAEGMEAQALKIQQLVKPRGPIVSTEGKQPSSTPSASDWLREKFQTR